MTRSPPHKISLAQCIKQGKTTLTIRCVTPLSPDKAAKRPSSAVRSCFHYSDVSVDRLIRLFGEETSITDIENSGHFACKVCGGRQIQVS